MKAVLISIQPRHVTNICTVIGKTADGKSIYKKTVEVRKKRPKSVIPFKCYIYCTSVKTMNLNEYCALHRKTGGAIDDWQGKVIGEFVCDEIEDYKSWQYEIDALHRHIKLNACIDYPDISKYLGSEKCGYGWHISNLVIYEKPKELSEFWIYNEELHKRHDIDDDGFCCYDETDCNGEALTDCGDAYLNILNCYHCWEEWSGWCRKLKRPPQSWCYVEEL